MRSTFRSTEARYGLVRDCPLPLLVLGVSPFIPVCTWRLRGQGGKIFTPQLFTLYCTF